MKRTLLEAKRLRTASTTSTTGAHVGLAQNWDEAKVRTNGRWAASNAATEWGGSARSGGCLVVRRAASPFTAASVGVSDRGAGAPTAGDEEWAATSISPSAWIRAPVGSATSQ